MTSPPNRCGYNPKGCGLDDCLDCNPPTAEPDDGTEMVAPGVYAPTHKPTAEPDVGKRYNWTDDYHAGHKDGYAVRRAEVLKPLRDIYARGRLTFRSDGNPDSVEAQEQEFRAAIRTGDGK